MKFLENFHRLKRIDRRIRTKSTGDSRSLANRLDVSERTVFRLLDTLKDMGADVKYCHKRCSYYYNEGKGLLIEIKLESVDNIKGGLALMASFQKDTCSFNENLLTWD